MQLSLGIQLDLWVSFSLDSKSISNIIFRKPPCNPITIDYLCALHRALDLSKPMHAAIWAIVVVAFWACRQLGEPFLKSELQLDPVTDISHATCISFYTVNGCCVLSFHLPWTKTTGIHGFDCVLTATGNVFCPVMAFKSHLIITVVLRPQVRPLSPQPMNWTKIGGQSPPPSEVMNLEAGQVRYYIITLALKICSINHLFPYFWPLYNPCELCLCI